MKSILSSYNAGIRFLVNHKKIWFLVYGLNVLFAILIAMPLSNYLHSTIGDSLATNQEFMTFNYTYINDFLHEFGGGLGVVWNQSIYVLLIHFLLAIFISGGIVSIIKQNNTYSPFSNFWKGGGRLFWRFFRLSFYYLLGCLLFTYVAWILFNAGGLSVFEMKDETGIINRFYILVSILGVLFFLISIIHVFAKLEIAVSDETWIHHSIIRALRKFRRHFWSALGLALLNVLVLGSVALLYFWFRKHYHFSNASILLIFILAQLFILFRIGCRVIRVASFEEIEPGQKEAFGE